MAIHKIGYPVATSRDEAERDALERIRAAGDGDPVIAGPDVITSPAHEAAGEYLIRYETGPS